MQFQTVLEDAIYFLVDEKNLETLIKKFEKKLPKGEIVGKKWKKIEKERKDLPTIYLKRSKVQEDTWMLFFELPITQGPVSIWIKTEEIPYFIRKDESGPAFLLNEIKEVTQQIKNLGGE